MEHHHHHHHHSATRNIRMVFFLNLGFTIVEVIGGLLTNSTAILADAVHDLGDSVALAQAWYFERLTQRQGDRRYTYGLRRFSLLGALISTLMLMVSSFFVLAEAVPRILAPQPSDAQGMVVLALIGVAVNGYGMLHLVKEKGINARAVGLHLLEDVLGWLAILVVAVILLFVDLPVLDPILAVLITVYIFSNIIKNLRAIFPIFMQAAPAAVDMDELAKRMQHLPHVATVHSMHVWSLDGEHQVFSAHVVVDSDLNGGQYQQLKQGLRELMDEYAIEHSTVEVEMPSESCRMQCQGLYDCDDTSASS